MYELARYARLCLVFGCVGGSDADKLTIRCLLSGMPPEKWLDYCDMSSPMLRYLGETDGRASRIPADAKRAMLDKTWIRNEMEHQSKVYWENKARDFEEVDFPVEEFFDMLRRMTTLHVGKRLDADQIARHAFWRKFRESTTESGFVKLAGKC